MARRLPPVLLACLLLLAGCGGLGGTDADDASTATLTPAAVPEPPPTAAPGVRLPGEGATGPAVDAARLLAADERVRAATSYRVVRAVRVRGDGWTTRVDRTRAVAANGTTYQRLDVEGTDQLGAVVGRGELWATANDSARYVRTYSPDGALIEQGRLPSTPRHYRVGQDLRGLVVRGGSYAVEPTADGAVLRSTGPVALPADVVPFALGEPRNASARLVVAESGLVRSVRVAYDARAAAGPVRVTIRHRLVDVGNTTVGRPTWV
jgi:hypothetical protein